MCVPRQCSCRCHCDCHVVYVAPCCQPTIPNPFDYPTTGPSYDNYTIRIWCGNGTSNTITFT